MTNNKDDLKKILKYILATLVLHNLLIDYDHNVPEEWIEDDDSSELDNPGRANDELDLPVPIGSSNDERCQQLVRYQLEQHVMQFL